MGSSTEVPSAAAALPPLAARYLDSSVKQDAQRTMAKQRREAAAIKSRLQNMFRELDRLEKIEAEKRDRKEQSEMSHLPKPLSEKIYRRHAAALDQYRKHSAMSTPTPAAAVHATPAHRSRSVH